MRVTETAFAGVKIVEPEAFGDARGWFCEQYNAARYKAAGILADFVQDNESLSAKGVVRGLHWQAGEHAQAKLVRVIRGAVWDVAVDIRKGSPTFGKHVSEVLTGENRKQFFIPRGFAHGFEANGKDPNQAEEFLFGLWNSRCSASGSVVADELCRMADWLRPDGDCGKPCEDKPFGQDVQEQQE